MSLTHSRRRHCRASRRRFLGCGCGCGPRPRRLWLEWLEVRTLLAAGDLDTSFGSGGLVTTDLSGLESFDEAMAVVPTGTDGGVVVAGSSDSGIALVRYLAGGSLDPAFGNGGKTTVALPGGFVRVRAATVQSDGRLLVAGYFDPTASTPWDFLVARFTATGALDPTFDGDGWVTTDFGSTTDGAWGVAVDSAGRIVVAGFAYTSYSASNFAVARYLSDGSLDPSFSGDGKLTTDFAGGADFGMSVLIDAAGRIVVGGETDPVGTDGGNLAAARFHSDGTLDTTFGAGGRATVDFGASTDHGGRLALHDDGTLIVAGYSTQNGTRSDFALARFTSGGVLDQTFGDHGRVITDVGGSWDYLEAIKVDADRRLVASGYATVPVTERSHFALVRYNPDGTLDATFGGNGRVTTDLGSWVQQGKDLCLVDGKILVAGIFMTGTDHDFALLRYEGTLPAPRVKSHTPIGELFGPVSRVQLTFSEPMAPGSFTLADDVSSLQGPAGAVPVTGFQWLAANLLELSFPPQTAAGNYQLAVGPQILDLQGLAMDQDWDNTAGEAVDDRYTATFTVLPEPPRVVGQVPTGVVTAPVTELQVEFDQAMRRDSFSVADDVVSFSGPAGPLAISNAIWLDDDTLKLQFTAQRTPGDYTLILGVDILSAHGFALDQDRDLVPGETIEDRYPAAFTIDQPPRVVAQRPAGAVTEAVSTLQFDFSRPMDPASFVPAEDVRSFTGPGGALSVTGYRWIDADTLELSFAELRAPGVYQLVLGPDLRTPAGSRLDQDNDLVAGEDPEDRYTAVFEITSGPWIISHTPSGDQVQPVSEVRVTFDGPINSGTFSREDVSMLGPAGPVSISQHPQLVSGNEYRISFAQQTAYGTYHVYVGPNIANAAGLVMDQDRDGIAGEPLEDRYDASFTLLDVTGPRVTGHAPALPINTALSYVDLTFNEAIASSSFNPADATLSGPAGAIAVGNVQPLAADRFRVSFPPQSAAGTYRLTLGPAITDTAGNWMDQDADGDKGEAGDDQYTAVVQIDLTPPAVAGHSLAGVQYVPVTSFELTFTEPIDGTTFGKQDVAITGPSGSVAVTSVTQLAPDRFRIALPATVWDGTFTVAIAPVVADLAGNPLPAPGYQFQFVQQLPDLVVTAVVVPTEAIAGQEIEVQWTVTNLGAGTALGAWWDAVCLSTDSRPGGDVQVVQLRFDAGPGGLAPGESYTRNAFVPIAPDAAGSRWIVLQADQRTELVETVETNNTAVGAPAMWITRRPYPDLQVAALVTPPTLPTAETSAITWTVRNLGTGPTSARTWYDAVYLSLDAVLDGRDIKLGEVRNPDFLTPGEQYTQTADMLVPEDLAHGQYYVLVKTDHRDNEEEFDLEGNNVTAAPATAEVLTPPPGVLEVVSVVPPPVVVPGSYFRDAFSYTIRNAGGAKLYGRSRTETGYSSFYEAHWWDDAAVLSRDAVYDQDDYWIGGHIYHHDEPLLPGETRVIQRPVGGRGSENRFPLWEPGDYYLIIIPDTHLLVMTQGKLAERSYAAAPIRLAYPNPPDLAVSSVTAPAAAVSGQLAEFGWQVINQGTGSTRVGRWSDEVWLSLDQTLSGDDVPVGTFQATGPLNGANAPDDSDDVGPNPSPVPPVSYWAAASLNIPGGLVGDYYVLVKTDAAGQVPNDDPTNNVLASTAVLPIRLVRSDLVPAIDQAPLAARAGDVIEVQWTVQNQGAEPTAVGAWSDAWYLSDDETFDPPRDRQLKTVAYQGGPLGPADSYQRSTQLSLPGAKEGPHWLFLVTDRDQALYEHLAEGNNSVRPVHSLVIQDPAADLEVLDFTIAAGPYIAGRAVTLTRHVRNSGTEAVSQAWQDALYLSADAVFDAKQDRRISTFPQTPPLAVGAEYGNPTTATLPDGLAGSYYFFYVADVQSEIYEKKAEANNVASFGPVDVVDLKPDLVVQSASSQTAGTAGQFLDVYFTIANRGEEPARGPWWDALYLSANEVFDPDPSGEADSLFAVFKHSGDAAVDERYGPSATPAAVRLPDRAEGQYRIFLVPNYNQSIDELDHNDAYLLPDPVQITFLPPDLQVSNVTAPTAATAGTPIQVAWTTRNEGVQPTAEASWQDGVYLSTDNVFDPLGDLELGVVPHTGVLEPGAAYSASAWYTLRQDLEGPYHVYVATDVRRQVYEHNREDNNATEAPALLDVAGVHADLQAAAVVLPATVPMGHSVQVQWTVTNAGRDATAALGWSDAIYLSADAVLDAGDRRLASLPHDGVLQSQASYQRAVNAAILADAPGDYYLLVKTDSAARNDVYEFQAEDNNVAAVPIQVTYAPTPDLQVAEIVAPAEAWSGQNLHVEWTVQNAGAAPASSTQGGWFDSVYLSRDPYVDRNVDLYLGAVEYRGTLAAGTAYPLRQSLDAKLPAGISGPYYVLAVTDSNNRVFERAAEDNNIRAAAGTLQVNLTPPADLQVTGITVPAPAIYGEPATWTYQVTNQDTLDAYGAWVDTIYLSEDNAWDLSDPRIGRVYHDGDVPHAASYSETFTAAVPGLVPGEYYVIVRTDILNQLREIDETNNMGVSETKFQVLGRVLEMGVPAAGMLGPQQAVYFELPVGYLQDVRITVSGPAAATAELYVAGWSLPTRSAYDDRSAGSTTRNPQVRLSETMPGTRYVLVYGRQTSGTLPFEITAELLEAAVTGVTPNVGSNTGMVTVYVAGQNLPLDPAVELVSPSGESIPAVEITEASQTGFYAQFGLYSAAPGLYDLRISAAGVAEILAEDAVTVVEGGRGQLETRLIVPALVRSGAPFSISVEYANVGTADLVSPLLHVTGPAKIQFGLAPGEYVSRGSIQFLAYSSTGPAGVLQPGDREVLTFYCSGLTDDTFDFELTAIEVDPEATDVEIIDWPSLEDEYRPVFLTAEEWAPHWQVFTREIGCTWPEVVAFLARLFTENPTQSFLGSDLMQHAFEVLTLAGGLTGGGGLTDFDPPYVMSDMEVVPATGVVTGVDLIFSEIIDGTTLTADTLQIVDPDGNAIEATAIEARSDRLWRVSFAPQTAYGLYHVYVGPHVTDLVGQALDLDRDGKMGEAGDDLYDAQFWIGENSPVRAAESRLSEATLPGAREAALRQQDPVRIPGTHITGHWPNRPVDARDGVSSVTIKFSEPIQRLTFNPACVTLVPAAGGNPIPVFIADDPSSTSVYRIRFPIQTEPGTYRFSIRGHLIKDGNGQFVDLDKDGTLGEPDDEVQFEIMVKDRTGPHVVSVLGEGPVAGASFIDVRFSEPLQPFANQISDVTDLTGPETFEITKADMLDEQTIRYWFSTFLDTPGKYTLKIGPNVLDKAGNKMDQNQNGFNGEADDLRTVTLDVTERRLTVLGTVGFSGPLGNLFPNGAHVSVQLWEANGARDATPGLDAFQPDTLVSEHNVWSGHQRGEEGQSLVTEHLGTCEFFFIQDVNGEPIRNVDPDPGEENSGRDLYVVVFAKNEFAGVVDESTMAQAVLTGTRVSPRSFSIFNNDPKTFLNWQGRYYSLSSAPVVNIPGGPDAVTIVRRDVQIDNSTPTNVGGTPAFGTPFGLAEWIRYGAKWVEKEVGESPRKPIEVIFPQTRGEVWGWRVDAAGNWVYNPPGSTNKVPDVYFDNAFFSGGTGDYGDYIVVGRNELNLPATVLHEYGHSIQFAMNGYTFGTMITPPDGDAYGMIQISASANKAFSEAWASYFAAKTLAPLIRPGQPNDVWSLMIAFCRMRGDPDGLETNDYWRAYSAYNLAGNANANDGAFTTPQLRARYAADAIHSTEQQGTHVMGAGMSILWDLSDGGATDDDQVDDVRGMWNAVKASAAENRLIDFYNSYGGGANIDHIFIDHGVTVKDDPLEIGANGVDGNDFQGNARPLRDKVPFSKTQLILAEQFTGAADWYEVILPKTANAAHAQAYSIVVGNRFTTRYGDLDLFVSVDNLTDNQPRVFVDSVTVLSLPTATPLVPIEDRITIPNLRNDKRYRVLVGISGHGAVRRVGNQFVTDQCGDMHPDYTLFLAGQVPEPPRNNNVLNAATVSTNRGRDPNDKVTTGGYGESLYVPADALLPYTIHFENVADATASVVLLTVTDQLDPDLDWSSFELGDMEFGHQLVDVPPGLNYFESRIDLRPEGNNLLVDVVAELNPATGLVTWTFTAIDPATGEFTYDPLAGFLPPNTENHDGEGFVSYTVRPKADLPSGTEITNAATIVFDWNEPIDTPLVVNVIDSGLPESTVQALATQVDQEHFLVRWDGADDEAGAGVHSYDVYVSDNGGSFTRWLTRTTSVSAVYAGQFEHTYAFYSVALDNTGHLEAAPATADAATLLALYRWHHYANPYDVNAMDGVQPQDVLIIINWINANPGVSDLPAAPVAPPPYYDVKKDNRCTAQDVLLVINYINSHPAGSAGEGELAEPGPTSAEPQFAWPAWPAEPAYRRPASEPRATPPPAEWSLQPGAVLQDSCCEAVAAARSPRGIPLSRSPKTGPQPDPAQTDLAFGEVDDLLLDLVPLPEYC